VVVAVALPVSPGLLVAPGPTGRPTARSRHQLHRRCWWRPARRAGRRYDLRRCKLVSVALFQRTAAPSRPRSTAS